MPTVKTLQGEEVEYIEVYDEPIHEQQFRNEYGYCYVATLRPGQTCLWHRHKEDSFYISLAGAECINRPCDQPEAPLIEPTGQKWWSFYKSKPVIHQVCMPSSSTAAATFLGVEVLKPPPIGRSEPLSHYAYTLNAEFSTQRARVYDLALAPGESTGMHTWGFYGVIISMSDGALSSEGNGSPFADVALSAYGGCRWLQGPVTFSVTNTGSKPYLAVVVELLQGAAA